MNTKKQSGNYGEDLAARFLQSRNYEIAARNFHSRYGEIDIVAEDEKYIAFVEVKTRSMSSYGLPREAVDIHKQRKIIKTAYIYLSQNDSSKQPRFDVIEVYLKSKNELKAEKLTHIKGAFELNGDEDFALF